MDDKQQLLNVLDAAQRTGSINEPFKAPVANALEGKIAVDTLNRPADPNVTRGVEVVNQFQNRNTSPSLNRAVSTAVSTPAPQPVEQTPQDQNRELLAQTAQDILGTNVAEDRAKVREDLMIAQKEERARTLSNQITARDREIQKERERIEKNLRADSRGGLESQLAKFNRESARELADLSFSYQVALGDYQAAEKIASEYMSDLQAEQQQKAQAWNMLFQLTQNDMTESEKLQAQQAFTSKQMQDQYDLDIKKIQFENNLKQAQADSGIKAPDIKEINGVSMQWDPTNGVWVPATTADEATAGKAVETIDLVQNTINQARELANAAGPSFVRRAAGDFFVGDTEFRRLEQLTNTIKTNVLTIAGDPNIRDFFGPQMSEADVRMMTSSGTTLDAQANSPQDYLNELNRLAPLFDKLGEAAQEKAPAGGGNVITAPDGRQIEIID